MPDRVANAGGVITGASGLLGRSAGLAAARIDHIYRNESYRTTTDVLLPYRAAHRMARAQLVA